MSDFDFQTLPEIIAKLPAVGDVREWAMQMLASRGDAHCDQYAPDGLNIESFERMGEQPDVALERVRGFMQGGIAITRRIEVATYPNKEFDQPFWDYPDRTWTDLRGDTRKEIKLPYPLIQPILVRRTEWRSSVDSWGDRPYRSDCEIVTYLLIELEPEQQQRLAEIKIGRLRRGIITEADEMRAWAAGKL